MIGPGTGLGMGFLTKDEDSPHYQIHPSESGHSDFAPRSEQDFRLHDFCKDYIENSNNCENTWGKGKGKIERVSIERVCAGPGVPLIYAFMKKENPEIEDSFAKDGKDFDSLTAMDIVERGMSNKDELCMLTIEKFTEILAVHTGNMALALMPYGGIYLVGGVI